MRRRRKRKHEATKAIFFKSDHPLLEGTILTKVAQREIDIDNPLSMPFCKSPVLLITEEI